MVAGSYENEFERTLHEDAYEVAKRTTRYKFGRLSNRRILAVLHDAAVRAGIPITQSDDELLEMWFATYEQYRKALSSPGAR